MTDNIAETTPNKIEVQALQISSTALKVATNFLPKVKMYLLSVGLFSFVVFIISVVLTMATATMYKVAEEKKHKEVAEKLTLASHLFVAERDRIKPYVDTILAEITKQGITNKNQIAYILATAEHETANFRYFEEIDGPNQAIKNNYEGGKKYYGRGFVQLTHLSNYRKYAEITKHDLVNEPEQVANNKELASYILVDGMKHGRFTGRKLDDYSKGDSFDFVNARQIVNGNDKAKSIADLAKKWLLTYFNAL